MQRGHDPPGRACPGCRRTAAEPAHV